jgi:hypothetical protein
MPKERESEERYDNKNEPGLNDLGKLGDSPPGRSILERKPRVRLNHPWPVP